MVSNMSIATDLAQSYNSEAIVLTGVALRARSFPAFWNVDLGSVFQLYGFKEPSVTLQQGRLLTPNLLISPQQSIVATLFFSSKLDRSLNLYSFRTVGVDHSQGSTQVFDAFGSIINLTTPFCDTYSSDVSNPFECLSVLVFMCNCVRSFVLIHGSTLISSLQQIRDIQLCLRPFVILHLRSGSWVEPSLIMHESIDAPE